MNNKLKYVLLAMGAMLANLSTIGTANAGALYCDPNGGNYGIYCEAPTGGGSGGLVKHTENRIYSGFVWELSAEQGLIPDFIIGVRSLQVKDDVNGVDASFRIKYQDKLSPDSLRIAYVGGKRDIMGNVGAGYSFTYNSWLATAAIQGPYTRLSTDYLFADRKFRYYAEINTLDKATKIMRPSGDGTCNADGYTLMPVSEISSFTIDTSYVVNGKTCILAG